MANLSIDRNLDPGQNIEFQLALTLFGEEVYDVLSLTVPNAPTLVNKLKNIEMRVSNRDKYIFGNNKRFSFVKYKKFGDVSPSRYKFLMVLASDKNVGDLAPDDEVVINCPDAGFVNVQGIILADSNKRKKFVYASINKNIQPLTNQDLNTSGTVQEYRKKIKIRDITVSVPQDFLKTLVSEKPTTPPKKGNVEDIIIFAYKQFNGPNKSSIKYKLMINDSEINLKNPPIRTQVLQYRGQRSYKKSFTLNSENGERVLCYIAIARYTYDGEEWKGEWLQTNDSDEVIWGRAG